MVKDDRRRRVPALIFQMPHTQNTLNISENIAKTLADKEIKKAVSDPFVKAVFG